MKTILVAVAGNPNVGKTTILNHIAGTDLKVGNWPGVTVEKKEALVEFMGYRIHLVDLPGVYTLDPVAEDERIAVSFLEKQNPDVILNIVETPNLERNLFLTTELLELGRPTVLVLNMWDEAIKQGIEVDTDRMKELLNVEVVKTVGRTGEGVEDILPAVVRVYEEGRVPKVTYSPEIEGVLSQLSGEGSSKRELIAILENTPEKRKPVEEKAGKPLREILDDERYAFVHGLSAEVMKKRSISRKDVTDALDRVVLHPLLGFPVFVGVVYITFKIAFDFSTPFVDWVDSFMVDFLGPSAGLVLKALNFPDWFVRFFSEAVVGGVGFVLTFVPLIGTLYLLITLLEMSGYIPRVAFLMDRFMHRLGLHGRSVIPLIMGFGCNVPAIIATRTMESTRDKILVTMMIPFMSCPARLVVFAFFVSIFFRENPALVITFLYLLGILVAVATAFFLRKAVYRGSLSHFVMELPPYRFPSFKTLITITWVHLKDFLYRAGTLIFGASVFIWLLLNTPPGAGNISESLAGKIGKVLVPVFEPIGIDNWKATTSLIPAFLAREIVISSMGTIYTAEEAGKIGEFNPKEEFLSQMESLGTAVRDAFVSLVTLRIAAFEVEEEEEGLKDLIRKDFTPSSALSFMTFILIYTSCLGTFAVLVREIGRKRAVLFLGYSFVAAWTVSFVVYRVSSLVLQ
ncbi:MAG: ferrous iron transport protein B [Aquificota bacterium]|nr:ferrous iron transport protein B [Aquificota bacterium]